MPRRQIGADLLHVALEVTARPLGGRQAEMSPVLRACQ